MTAVSLQVGRKDLANLTYPVDSALSILTDTFCEPQETANPCHEFARRERLDHIIVRAKIQTGYAIGLLRPGVRKMIGVCRPDCRSSRQTSKPFFPGSITSRRMRSNPSSIARRLALTPFAITST